MKKSEIFPSLSDFAALGPRAAKISCKQLIAQLRCAYKTAHRAVVGARPAISLANGGKLAFSGENWRFHAKNRGFLADFLRKS